MKIPIISYLWWKYFLNHYDKKVNLINLKGKKEKKNIFSKTCRPRLDHRTFRLSTNALPTEHYLHNSRLINVHEYPLPRLLIINNIDVWFDQWMNMTQNNIVLTSTKIVSNVDIRIADTSFWTLALTSFTHLGDSRGTGVVVAVITSRMNRCITIARSLFTSISTISSLATWSPRRWICNQKQCRVDYCSAEISFL